MARQSLVKSRIVTMRAVFRVSCTTVKWFLSLLAVLTSASSYHVQDREPQQIEHIGERDIPELDIVGDPVSTVGSHVVLFGHVHSSISKPRPRRPSGTAQCNWVTVDVDFALDELVPRLPTKSIYNVNCTVVCPMAPRATGLKCLFVGLFLWCQWIDEWRRSVCA